MLKLNNPISIGEETFTHMIFVRGEFDLRLPAVDLHPALVRADGKCLYLGRVRLTNDGPKGEFTELLPVVRLAARTDSHQELLTSLMKSFTQWMENLEQVAVGIQADKNNVGFQHFSIALSKFPLSCTFEPLGDREVGLEIIEERSEEERIAQALGFINAADMNHMIANVDLSTPSRLRRFEQWKEKDGTKVGLRKLMEQQSQPEEDSQL